MWLGELKKALLVQDFSTLERLIDTMPQFDSSTQIEEAAYLLSATRILLEEERHVALSTMNQLKTTLNFLKASETSPPSSLNLKF